MKSQLAAIRIKDPPAVPFQLLRAGSAVVSQSEPPRLAAKQSDLHAGWSLPVRPAAPGSVCESVRLACTEPDA